MNLQLTKKFSLSLFLLLAISVGGFAQARSVTGQVTDPDGKPVAGVTVVVKGTAGSVITDKEGRYRVMATPEQSIEFSSIGFTTKEVKVAQHPTIEVSLTRSDSQLDDVIVVGYGTQKKAHLTGSVETIKTKEIEDLPVSNLGAALTGRVIGLSVSGGMSRPGSKATLTLRNPETYSKDGGVTGPLFVIDGVLQVTGDGKPDITQFNALDPSEVESITFLKDAAAAIFGSRAANGVVIVTTKKGKAGAAPRISYSGTYASTDETYRTKMMSAYDFGMYMNIMNGPNGNNKQGIGGTEEKKFIFSDDEMEYLKTVNYDWLDPVWHAANNMRHTLNVSGGTDKATYYAGASYFTQDGNMGTLDYKKYTFRAGADIQAAAGLKTGLTVAGNFDNVGKTFSKIGNESDDNDYRNLLLTPRYVPMYVDGFPVKVPGSATLSGYHYYELQRLNNLATNKNKTLNINAYAEYEMPWVKGLKFRVNYSRYFNNANNTQVGTKYTLYDFNRVGTNNHIFDGATVLKGNSYSNGNRLTYSSISGESEQTNFTVNYSKTIDQHSISALASVEKGEAYMQQADAYRDDPLQSTNGQFSTAFGAIDGKTLASESGTLSYIGRLNYSYASRYLLEVLFRTDASTHFAPENYWGKFYSISAGWVISAERFWNVSAVNFLKVRASTGQLGRDDTKAWLWRQRYTAQNGKGGVFGGNNSATAGMKMEAAPNRNATWSNEQKNNVGIDARFLNNHLSATLDGFYNKATNLLMERNANAPITVGGNMAAQNFGKVDFYGYEVSLGWNDRIARDFSYGIDVRFSWYDSKIRLGDYKDLDAAKPWNGGNGKSGDIGAWGMDYLGMFKNQEDIDNYVKAYNITSLFGYTPDRLKPGMFYYRDIRGQQQADGSYTGPDGVVDVNDQIRLSKKESNHYNLGATLKAGYKGIGFECVISGSFGGYAEIDGNTRVKMDNEIDKNYQSRPAFWNNIYDPVLNPTGTQPNPQWADVSLSPRSSYWMVSAFRLAMRQANLNYTLPRSVISAMRISNARVFVSVLNPLNFYNPYDYKAPDGAYDVFPVLRTISAGANLTL